MLFTVFTPTYNRAHTLPRLYKSLLNQTFKDFEWVVVDDGSEDDTEEVLKNFIEENRMPIVYKKQSNQGKHIAINQGMALAKGRYFLVIDSDDWLLPHALEKSCEMISKIDHQNDFAGFTFIRFSENTAYDPKKYGKKEWTQGAYQWEFSGEMSFVFKTEIVRQFPFPQFEGEKFCPESLVLRRILRKYQVLFTDCVLAHGDYLEDGLSQNYYQRLKKNPKAAMLSYKEKIGDAQSSGEKKLWAKNYWDIALSAQHIPWREKLSGISWFWTAKILGNKLLKKLLNNKK